MGDRSHPSREVPQQLTFTLGNVNKYIFKQKKHNIEGVRRLPILVKNN